ncbi:hypothetical protein OH77DRAFT_910490 [Trametes cingulata]|nr:hypothetical protein OH77DRAFT_910490 [Trametes cingulata]
MVPRPSVDTKPHTDRVVRSALPAAALLACMYSLLRVIVRLRPPSSHRYAVGHHASESPYDIFAFPLARPGLPAPRIAARNLLLVPPACPWPTPPAPGSTSASIPSSIPPPSSVASTFPRPTMLCLCPMPMPVRRAQPRRRDCRVADSQSAHRANGTRGVLVTTRGTGRGRCASRLALRPEPIAIRQRARYRAVQLA